MAKQTLIGTYSAGYLLQLPFSKLLISGTALVEGIGVRASSPATVTNNGSIIASNPNGDGVPGNDGIALQDGGRVSNHGLISAGEGGYTRPFGFGGSGGEAVYLASGMLTNGGTMIAGHGGNNAEGGNGTQVHAYGSVFNTGLIAGGAGGGGFFAGDGGSGVDLQAGGAILNKAGTIVGGVGGVGVSDYHYNYYYASTGGTGGSGLQTSGVVKLTNRALIAGGGGGAPYIGGYGGDGGTGAAVASGSIDNAGILMGGAGGDSGTGTHGYAGGTGGSGINATAAVSLTNTGTVVGGVGGYGEYSGGFRAYAGAGGSGISTISAFTLTNMGVVEGGAGGAGGGGMGSYGRNGGAGGAGVTIDDGGSFENLQGEISGGAGGAGGYGSKSSGQGGSGGDGVDLLAGGETMDNLGTIAGGMGGAGGGGAAAGGNGDGIVLADGGTAINGGHKSLIEGEIGVRAGGSAATTVVNYGTIDGTGGIAVAFASAADRLVARAQSDFIGLAQGGGGTLEVTGGTGSITGVGGVGLASGSLTLNFTAFGAYVFDGADAWTMTGTNTLASAQKLTDAGSLTISGTLTNAGTLIAAGGGTLTVETALANTGTLVAEGTLIAEGVVNGAGVAHIEGGTMDLMANFNQAVTFIEGAGVLALARSQNYRRTVYGFSNTGGTVLDLGDITFVNAGEATFSGTTGGGVLTVTDGKHTSRIQLKGDYLDATFTASSDGHGGTAIMAETAPKSPSPAVFAATMAAFGASSFGGAHLGASWPIRQALLSSPRAAIA